MAKKGYDELLTMMKGSARKKPDDREHRLQCECVRLFRLLYPEYRNRLFAVPNGGRRDAVTGARLKAEGVLAGVADLILLVKNRQYGALLLELKTETGRQSSSQKEWEKDVTATEEYKYVVIRSVGEFCKAVNDYLK